jgi:ABC-type dipeptide/oligopeptide/nickel transport system permease subunit
MRWVDFKESLKDFAHEFKREKTGILGLLLLILLIVVAAGAPIFTVPNFPDKWRNPQYWETYPRTVPPVWYDKFTTKDLVPQRIYTLADKQSVELTTEGGNQVFIVKYPLEKGYYYGPQGIIIKGFNISAPPGVPFSPKLTVYLERPDGGKVLLVKNKDLDPSTTIAVGRDSKISAWIYLWLVKSTGGTLDLSLRSGGIRFTLDPNMGIPSYKRFNVATGTTISMKTDGNVVNAVVKFALGSPMPINSSVSNGIVKTTATKATLTTDKATFTLRSGEVYLSVVNGSVTNGTAYFKAGEVSPTMGTLDEYLYEVALDVVQGPLLIRDLVKPLFASVDPKDYNGATGNELVNEILNNPKTLHGTYKLELVVTPAPRTKVKFDTLKAVFLGRVFGHMGTDYQGRDLWAALIWGSRISLVIGITVSILSTIIGIVYGVTSAYLGGNADEILMRINELFSSIPSLPILILIGATMGHISLGMMVLLLVIFGWMGVARISRSMALQIKEQTYIEAAKALGAGTGRIVFKHILPQLLPYAFAVIALGVPVAVISEASLSFLGLGDPTAVTWGQILHDAEVQSAATKGYWWWVLPPGFGIATVGLTFVLIGTALDRILNPRLRRL